VYLFAILSLIAVFFASAASAAEGPIKFAFSGPLTGDYAEYGRNFRTAAEVAVEQINANGGLLGGRKVELVVYDDKNSSEEASTIAEAIVSDPGIAAVFGHFSSGVAMTAANTYMDTGIVLMSASASHPDYSSIGEYIFRNNILIKWEMRNQMQTAHLAGYKRMGVISLKTDWGQGARAALESGYEEAKGKLSYEIVGIEEIVDGQEDFSATITNFMEKKADCVMVLAMYASMAPFAIQYRALNPEIGFISGGSTYSVELIKLGGSAVEGTHLVAGINPKSEVPLVKSFVERYRAKLNRDPDNMAAQTYDNVLIVADAIERAGSADRKAIMKALYGTDFEGVSGHVAFDETGDAQKTQLIFEIKDGEFVERTDRKLKPWGEFLNSLQ
jgi:branched-chain amino acid transport system substrate-binding protein